MIYTIRSHHIYRCIQICSCFCFHSAIEPTEKSMRIHAVSVNWNLSCEFYEKLEKKRVSNWQFSIVCKDFIYVPVISTRIIFNHLYIYIILIYFKSFSSKYWEQMTWFTNEYENWKLWRLCHLCLILFHDISRGVNMIIKCSYRDIKNLMTLILILVSEIKISYINFISIFNMINGPYTLLITILISPFPIWS